MCWSGYHSIQLTTSRDIALNRGSRSCYKGKDYTEQEYIKLDNIIQERFQSRQQAQDKFNI